MNIVFYGLAISSLSCLIDDQLWKNFTVLRKDCSSENTGETRSTVKL